MGKGDINQFKEEEKASVFKNIYGEEITLRAKPKIKGGYAAPPGTGPEGQTCGTCKHHCVRSKTNSYHKCGLMMQHWTGGAATDIKVRSPSCSKWEPTE